MTRSDPITGHVRDQVTVQVTVTAQTSVAMMDHTSIAGIDQAIVAGINQANVAGIIGQTDLLTMNIVKDQVSVGTATVVDLPPIKESALTFKIIVIIVKPIDPLKQTKTLSFK